MLQPLPSTAWWHCYVELCACVWLYVCACASWSVHVYLFAEWVSWFVFQLHLWSLDLCAFVTFSLLVFSRLSSVFAVCQSICLPAPWSLLWKADSVICSNSTGYFSSCSCFNQPAGCTVAEGSTRGFYPAWTLSHNYKSCCLSYFSSLQSHLNWWNSQMKRTRNKEKALDFEWFSLLPHMQWRWPQSNIILLLSWPSNLTDLKCRETAKRMIRPRAETNNYLHCRLR